MESKLKLNHWLFSWYYKRCGEHFEQWTFIKSVKMLIQNYKHLNGLYEIEVKSCSESFKEADKLRKELSDMRIKQIATDGQIDWANKTLGANIRKDSEN